MEFYRGMLLNDSLARRLLGIVVSCAAAGCGPAASSSEGPPRVTARETLMLKLSEQRSQPLRVVSVAPEGRVQSTDVHVNLVFNKPLRGLSLAAEEPVPRFSIEPELLGDWRWVGTSAVTFFPADDEVRAATRYTVTVPAGLQAQDETRLSQAVSIQFETPRPRLEGIRVLDDALGVTPSSKFAMDFNLPVSPTALSSALHVSVKPRSKETAPKTERSGQSIEVDLVRDADAPSRLVLAPKRPLPVDAEVTFEIQDTLQSEEGPLPSDEEYTETFQTYGPLEARLECDGNLGACVGWPHLVFSNPVHPAVLTRAIRVSPGVRLDVRPRAAAGHASDHFTLAGGYHKGPGYRVRVDPRVKDVFGQSLSAALVEEFSMGEGVQVLELGAMAGLLEPDLGSTIMIGSVNVDAYDELTLALSPAEVVAYLRATDDPIERLMPRFDRRRVDARRGLNQQHDHRVPFQRVLGRRFGAMLVGYFHHREGAKRPDTQAALVQSTNLSVTARLSAEGGIAWVTRMSDGRSVPDATLRFVGVPGKQRLRFRTDERGVAVLQADDVAAVRGHEADGLLVVETPDDWSYAAIPTLAQYDYRVLAKVFTDRDIYRPGEVVFVKGWVREERELGSAPVSDHPVTLRLKHDDTVEAEIETRTNAFGGFSAALKLPALAALDHHQVEVEAGETFRDSIRVGEYRSSEFVAEVDVQGESYVRGESIAAKVRGEYLFGGPMNGARVDFWASPSRTHHVPKGTGAFSTDAWQFRGELRDLLGVELSAPGDGSSLLDDSGRREVEFATSYELLGPVRVGVYATVYDKSRQAVTGSDRVLVHPGSSYVGVSVPTRSAKPGASLRPGVVAVALDGKRLLGRQVTLELYQRRFSAGGQRSPPLKVDSCKLTTRMTSSSCGLKLGGAGDYIVLARGVDDAENPLYAATSVHVGGAYWGGDRASFEDYKHLDVAPNRSSYRVGEVAQVRVVSPLANADVLLSLEQRGVLWHDRKRARGHVAMFEVPITRAVGGNAQLTAHVARSQTKPKRPAEEASYRPWDSGPSLLTSTASIVVDRSEQKLRVEVIPETSVAAPGDDVKVRLEVTDAAGEPRKAELAVFAVDEGVLMLTGYVTPDPWGAFTPDRHNVVSMSDSRERMGWLYTPDVEERAGQGFGVGHGRLGGAHKTRAPKIRMGSTSVSGSRSRPKPRDDFRTTPYFNPSVVTDDQGRAEVTVPLSQLLTSYRLMAVASSRSDYYGRGEANVETRLPLMVRPAMPRFARVGDRFDAGVLISSSAVSSDAVVVTAKAKGLALQGPARKSFAIAETETREVHFAFRAKRPGTAKLTFEVEAGSQTDSVSMAIPIQAPLSPEAVALYGKTDAASGERIAGLQQASPHYGSLDVALSSTALVGLDNGIEQLLDYPYGCTEQLSSRLMPLLPLRDLARDFGIVMPDDLDGTVRATLHDILTRQRYDGGFGLWPNDPESHPWLTAYVLRVLDEANRRGAEVPDRALEAAFKYLVSYAHDHIDDEYYRPTLAFIAHVFAEYGHPSRIALERLMDGGDEDPAFVKALTLQALAKARKHPERTEPNADRVAAWRKRIDANIEKLGRALSSELRISGNRAFIRTPKGQRYPWLFDSGTRTNAMVLSALLEVDPKHPLAERLARGVLADREDGGFRSTQDAAYALLALDSYRRKQEAVSPDFDAVVWLGRQALGRSEHRGGSLRVHDFSLPMGKVPKDGSLLAFEKRGEGTLFYEALLRYSPRELPKQGLDHGFHITSKLYVIERGELPEAVRRGYAPTERRFVAGDVVLGDVSVIVPTRRNFVVIEVPLAAGVEAIDTTLDANRDHGFVEMAPSLYARDWMHRELRDDRVLYFLNRMRPGVHRFTYLTRATTRGRFVVPPSRAEEMYAPENFGRTGAGFVQVR